MIMEDSQSDKKQIIEVFLAEESLDKPIPLFLGSVSAGFPSPADDFIEKRLNLNEMLIQHPAATFYVRVQGESMTDAGINTGDILVVDRSLEATNGKIVVAVLNGEFTVKRYVTDSKGVYLVPENPKFPRVKIDETNADFQIWGVVTYVIHKTG